MFNTAQKKELLQLARKTIEANFSREKFRATTDDPQLLKPYGVFVTLTSDGELRGCIGFIKAVEPLWKAVQTMAIQAAFRDPRFYPVKEHELEAISIEISVLSEMMPVTDIEEITVGRDGLFINAGYASGLLLPQVATEYGWDRDTFLVHTCRKAGLPDDAYRDTKNKLWRFEAEIFNEKTNNA